MSRVLQEDLRSRHLRCQQQLWVLVGQHLQTLPFLLGIHPVQAGQSYLVGPFYRTLLQILLIPCLPWGLVSQVYPFLLFPQKPQSPEAQDILLGQEILWDPERPLLLAGLWEIP